jgi:selenocysteine lyase/cysteine desulfurase
VDTRTQPAPSPWADRFAPFEVTYLDAATHGPLPLAASRAGREALALEERPWKINGATPLAVLAETRSLAARLFACREEAVALVTGAAQVVNAVARGLELHEGDEVVLARGELPANDLPWRWLARRGIRIRIAEPDHPTGAVSAGRLASAVGPRTRAIAFAHVSHLHGGRIDPAPVVDAARRVGALTVVDGSHAAGALPLDFGASGIDVYAAPAHRFLLGPQGCGLGLFSAAAQERLGVVDVNWWAMAGSEDPDRLSGPALDLKPGAHRYDGQEPASLNDLMPLAESLRLILEVTPARVQAAARSVNDRILAGLPRDLEPASPLDHERRSHVLCLAAASPAAAQSAHARLAEAKVVTTVRGDRIRVSPHVYNGDADADRLLAALRGD